MPVQFFVGMCIFGVLCEVDISTFLALLYGVVLWMLPSGFPKLRRRILAYFLAGGGEMDGAMEHIQVRRTKWHQKGHGTPPALG